MSSQTTSGNTFSFTNSPQTAPDDFYGFEIYYKFYYDDSGQQYQQDSTTLTSGQTGTSQLVNLGYRRAYLRPYDYQQGSQISQPETPLIPITDANLKTTAFAVTIDFTGMGSGGTPVTNYFPPIDINANPVVLQDGSQQYDLTMGRYMGDPSKSAGSGSYVLLGFGSGDFAVDQGTNNGLNPTGDVPPAVISDTQDTGFTQPMDLGLYAIAYGLVNLTTPIYSAPTPLGWLQVSAIFSSQTSP